MSYQILGRTVKNEHFALGVLGTFFGGIYLARTLMTSKKPEQPKTFVEKVKQAVPITAGTSEEEQLMASIKKYIEDAEREANKH